MHDDTTTGRTASAVDRANVIDNAVTRLTFEALVKRPGLSTMLDSEKATRILQEMLEELDQ